MDRQKACQGTPQRSESGDYFLMTPRLIRLLCPPHTCRGMEHGQEIAWEKGGASWGTKALHSCET